MFDKAGASLESAYSSTSPRTSPAPTPPGRRAMTARRRHSAISCPISCRASWRAMWQRAKVPCSMRLRHRPFRPLLAALGYDDLAGLDLSQEMLDIAAGRGAYKDLRRGVLGQTLPWPSGHFRAFLPPACLPWVMRPPRACTSSCASRARGATPSSPCATRFRKRRLPGGVRRHRARRPLEACRRKPWFRCYAVFGAGCPGLGVRLRGLLSRCCSSPGCRCPQLWRGGGNLPWRSSLPATLRRNRWNSSSRSSASS